MSLPAHRATADLPASLISPSDASPDELYSIVSSLQQSGKETEADIAAAQNTIRQLNASIDAMQQRVDNEAERYRVITSQTPDALRLADLAERVAQHASRECTQQQASLQTARQALCDCADSLVALSSSTIESEETSRTASSEPDTTYSRDSDERTPARATTSWSPSTALVQDARGLAEDVLATLRGLSRASTLPAGVCAVPDGGTPPSTRGDNGAEHTPPTSCEAAATAEAPTRKSISFMSDDELTTVIPVPGRNACRQPWPSRRVREASEDASDILNLTSPTVARRLKDTSLQLPCESFVDSPDRQRWTQNVSPDNSPAAAGALADPGHHVVVLTLPPGAAVMGTALLGSAPCRARASRRRTTWKFEQK